MSKKELCMLNLNPSQRFMLGERIGKNWRKVASNLGKQPTEIENLLHENASTNQLTSKFIEIIYNNNISLVALCKALIATSCDVVISECDFLWPVAKKMGIMNDDNIVSPLYLQSCSSLGSKKRSIITKNISSYWELFCQALNINPDLIKSKFPYDGASMPTSKLAEAFVNHVCETDLTVGEFFQMMRNENKGGICYGIEQEFGQCGDEEEMPRDISGFGTAFLQKKQNNSTFENNQPIKKQVIASSETDLDDVFSAEEEKKNNIQLLSDAIRCIATRNDVLTVVNALNQPNTNGSNTKFGWDFLLGTLEMEFPEAVLTARAKLNTLHARDSNENIALRCINLLLGRQQYAAMSWPQFLDKLVMLGHKPSAEIAILLRQKMTSTEEAQRVQRISAVQNHFDLQVIFANNPKITFKPGKSAADMIRFLQLEQGVQTLADLKEILEDSSNKSFLMEQGLTLIGFNNLKKQIDATN